VPNASEMAEPRGVILAGGRALRFGGQPKGLLEVGGIRILDRLVAAMRSAFGQAPLLVANAPGAASWHPDLEVVPDRVADAGTLGGLHGALVAAGAPIVCVAWDMPFVPAGLLQLLGRRLAGADAVLPRSSGPRGLEPLCAGYGPACLGPIEAAMARRDFRAIAFHPDVRLEILEYPAVEAFGDPGWLFFNVNAPEDLQRANQAPPARDPGAHFPRPAD